MSFKNLNKAELLKVAKFFDVDVTEDNTRPEILAALEESNVSWANYKKFVEPEQETEESFSEPTTETVGFNKMVLIKMERKNPTFEILGHKFTKDQPFQVVSESEAQDIIDAAEALGGGFRIATPAEAKSYFG